MLEKLFRLFRPKKSPGMRLMHYLQGGRSLQAFIGVPYKSPERWVKVSCVAEGRILCDDGQIVDPRQIQTFIVAYSNGELLDCEQVIFPWPDGIHEPKRTPRSIDTITLNELADGSQFVRVTHSPSRMPKTDKHYYSTTLTNLTDQRVQVLKFAGYTQISGDKYQVRTITGGYFTAEQFRAWYGLNERKWIEPGQSVCDPENYGGPGTLWAYFCRTESGDEFVVGAIAN